MSESYSITTSPINMNKVDKRSRLEGFNQHILPAGTKIRINKSSAEKINKLLSGWTIVSLSVVGFSGTIKCWLNTKGEPELLDPSDSEETCAVALYSVLKEDTSLETVLRTKYPYASPLEILECLLLQRSVSLDNLHMAADCVHKENVKKEN